MRLHKMNGRGYFNVTEKTFLIIKVMQLAMLGRLEVHTTFYYDIFSFFQISQHNHLLLLPLPIMSN